MCCVAPSAAGVLREGRLNPRLCSVFVATGHDLVLQQIQVGFLARLYGCRRRLSSFGRAWVRKAYPQGAGCGGGCS
jgi:hypothetical protein